MSKTTKSPASPRRVGHGGTKSPKQAPKGLIQRAHDAIRGNPTAKAAAKEGRAPAKGKAEPTKTKPAPLPKLTAAQVAVSADGLGRALRLCRKMVDEGSNMVALSHVLVEVKDGKARVTGHGGFPAYVQVDVGVLGGKGAVRLAVKPGIAEKAAKDTSVPFGTGRAVILEEFRAKDSAGAILALQFGLKAEVGLTAVDAKEMTELESLNGKELASGEFVNVADLLARVTAAVSDDDSRFVLQGVHLNEKELVATDGRRLHLVSALRGTSKLTLKPKDAEVKKSGLILPEKFVTLLAELNTGKYVMREVKGKLNAGAVLIAEGAGATLVMAPLDGVFPNYRQVVPEDRSKFGKHAVVGAEVLRVVHTAEIVHSKDKDYVTLTVGKNEMVIASRSEFGKADHLTVPVKDGKPVKVSVRSRYFVDAVKAAGDGLTLAMQDEFTPILIESPGFLAVVMPLRVAADEDRAARPAVTKAEAKAPTVAAAVAKPVPEAKKEPAPANAPAKK